ncbi:MAG TPA: alpha/beta hydrolase [bacterium]|nr:alpha/beta hydrolase [bacterium]
MTAPEQTERTPATVTRIADRFFPVAAGGRTVGMPHYATGDLLARHPAVTRFIVMINGTLRNADVYFASTVAAADAAGARPDHVLVTAPQFLATPDADALKPDADIPYWTPEGWKIGERSVHPESGPSSFAVLDAMLAAVLDRDRFPALQSVVVAGHSAGGQFVHRYIAFNRAHTTLRGAGVAVRYVVSNPSSYLYFDGRRLDGGGTLALYTRERCADYNRYRYGLEQPNEYGAAALAEFGGADGAAIAHEYGRREVAYLLGEADADPNSDSLDKSCGAMAQGATRLERGQRYFRYVQALLGPAVRATHSLHIVPGVGHDHRAMFTSPAGLALLFGDGRRAAQ